MKASDYRLPDNTRSSTGLSQGNEGVRLGKTAPSPDDAASSEGLGRGSGGAGQDEIGCTRVTQLLRPG